MAIEFTKYHGLGNDFILIDNRHGDRPLLAPARAQQLCDRHFGIGGDGVIFALPATGGADYAMRIYNSDGSEPEMCGNGIRCLARFLAQLEGAEDAAAKTYRIHTLAGIISPQLLPGGLVRVDMGEPILAAENIPTTLGAPAEKVVAAPLEVAGQTWDVTCVSMGNPHCIVFVGDVAAVPLEAIGPQFECHPAFPQRVNTEFVRVLGRDRLRMRVWERGAGATLACGTGACALVVAAVLNNLADRACTVELPGGNLFIEWSAADNRVYMSGPAERVFAGTLAEEEALN